MSSPDERWRSAGRAGPADVGLPGRQCQKCNFPILHKPYRREQLALHIRAAVGDPIVLA